MSANEVETDVAQLRRDLSEARAEQAATTSILAAISRPDASLEDILALLIQSAIALCGGARGVVWILRDGVLELGAHVGYPAEWVEHARAHPIAPAADSPTVSGRVAFTGEVSNVADLPNDPRFSTYGAHRLGDYRGSLCAPLIRSGQVVGVIGLTKPQPGLFSERQVDLIRRFADQAVIAIGNKRLVEEVNASRASLQKALDGQTAIGEGLKTIGRSAFDLEVVLTTLIDTAVRLCRGARGTIYLIEGDALVASAFHSNVPAELRDHLRATRYRLDEDRPICRAVRDGRITALSNAAAAPGWKDRGVLSLARFGSMLYVPLLRDGQPIGCLAMPREAVDPFTADEMGLVQAFADQVVIAMGNARLFNEVQARTRDLAASLEELRQAQDRLVQTEKLASLGQLTAGIAHEIKNPLNFVNNFAALSTELVDELLEVLAPLALADDVRAQVDDVGGLLKGNLEKIGSHGRRADSIVKTMLLHSRTGSGERRAVDVNALAEESLRLAHHGARAELPGFAVELQRAYDPDAGEADLFPQEITRVLLNVIGNGFYALRKQAEAIGPGYHPRLALATRGSPKTVEISVTDNGTGIADDVKQKMFDPFFTTKPAGEGTGLGLSLSHDIVVKQHGGDIRVDSRPGECTTFTITLPRTVGTVDGPGR